MGWDTMNIGASGLQAAQIGLNVTGNNITNASTPGYSRQQVTQAGATAAIYAGVFGTLQMGVDVTGIQRVYSDVLGAQVRQTQSASSGVSIYSTQVQQLDTLLSAAKSGVASALTSFQSGLQSLAASPADASVRQAAMSAAQSLVNSFQRTNAQLSQINTGINSQIQDSVSTINTLASQIAQVNVAITQSPGVGAGQVPSALLDQRAQLLQTLSQQVGVTVNTETDGLMVDVSIGHGVPLVTGSQATPLNVGYVNSPADASQTQAVVQFRTSSGSTQTMSDGSFGANGTLGGLLQFRNESLNQAQTAMGQIATKFAADFNAQNRLGLDINSAPGGNIFSASGNSLQMATTDPAKLATASANAVKTSSSTANTGTATIGAATTTSGYGASVITAGTSLTLTFTSATTYTVSGSPIAGENIAGNLYATGTPISLDGGTVRFTVNGTPAAGDTFSVTPYTGGVSDGTNAILLGKLQGSATATAVGVSTTSAAATIAVNGTGMDSTYSGTPVLQAGQTVKLTYTGPGFTATNPDGTTTAIASYTSGSAIKIDGLSFTITGVPAAGETFTATASGVQAQAATANKGLAAITVNGSGVDPAYTGTPLQAGQTVQLVYNTANNNFAVTSPDGTQSIVAYTSGSAVNVNGLSFIITGTGGNAPQNGDTYTVALNVMSGKSYADGYSALVNLIGNTTSVMSSNNTAQSAMLSSAQTALQSQSGVNLDEEAAHLIQYQQAYQASAKVISIAQQVLDNLFAIP